MLQKKSVSPGSLVRCRRKRRLLPSNVLPHTSTLLTKASQAPLPSSQALLQPLQLPRHLALHALDLALHTSF